MSGVFISVLLAYYANLRNTSNMHSNNNLYMDQKKWTTHPHFTNASLTSSLLGHIGGALKQSKLIYQYG